MALFETLSQDVWEHWPLFGRPLRIRVSVPRMLQSIRRGSTFYYLFKERIVIRGHVSLLATFNIAAAAAVACPCTPPAKTGPQLLLLSSIPSRSSEISRKGIPTCNLHSRCSLVDFTFAIVLSSDLPYKAWRSASLRETKNTLHLKIDLSVTALKTALSFAMSERYIISQSLKIFLLIIFIFPIVI